MCVSLGVLDTVKEPVKLGAPSATVRLIKLCLKVLQCLLATLVHLQRSAQVLNIFQCLQLGYARPEHHHKERYKQVGVIVKCKVRLIAKSLKSRGNESGTVIKSGLKVNPQCKFTYCSNSLVSSGFSEPLVITCRKSYVNTKGTLSRLMPNFFLKCPRKCPKSM